MISQGYSSRSPTSKGKILEDRDKFKSRKKKIIIFNMSFQTRVNFVVNNWLCYVGATSVLQVLTVFLEHS